MCLPPEPTEVCKGLNSLRKEWHNFYNVGLLLTDHSLFHKVDFRISDLVLVHFHDSDTMHLVQILICRCSEAFSNKPGEFNKENIELRTFAYCTTKMTKLRKEEILESPEYSLYGSPIVLKQRQRKLTRLI